MHKNNYNKCRLLKADSNSHKRVVIGKRCDNSAFDLTLILKLSKAAALAYVLAMPVTAQSQSVSANQKATISKAGGGISAPLEDKGDYYLKPDGSKVSFYRKQDVYILKRNSASTRNSSGSPMQRIKAQFGERVEEVKNHRLGFSQIVRINNSKTMKAKTKQDFDVVPAMLSTLDRRITALEPVFANSRGSGDIALTNKLLLKLASTDEPQAALESLAERYRFSVQNKLRVPGNVYTVVLKSDTNTPAEKFALVRRIMREQSVVWAQPAFRSKPTKTSFEPADPLFTQQWHLRNTGIQGSRCDTDCDANNAWGLSNGNGSINNPAAGAGMVIAVLDDGVQLNHEDLRIWTNPNEPANDADGFIGDINGWDFVDDGLIDGINPSANFAQCLASINANANFNGTDLDGVSCRCANDGLSGPDNDPNPRVDSACIGFNGDNLLQDNHGTAVAGIAAAIQGNTNGGVGVAFNAEILPIRLVSEFDSGEGFCARAAEAIAYAGQFADVINNSWTSDVECQALNDAIADVVAGTLTNSGGGNVSKRANGSPVIFASGNEASGWVKVTAPVTAGEHAYEWRFLRSAFPSQASGVEDTIRLDDITFPDNSEVDFESAQDLAQFTNQCDLNICASGECDPDFGFIACPLWSLNTNPNFSRSGNNSAQTQVSLLNDPSNPDTTCTYTYLHTIREEANAGEISFWVWVSADPQENTFEFLIDGQEVVTFGDTDLLGTQNNFVNNAVAYPANLATTIAVGASGSGDLSGNSTVNLEAEQRNPYSQFGADLDLVAPSSDQHLGIVTTDRYPTNSASDGQGFNAVSAGALTNRYTNAFTGTSASAPIVAGVAAAMLAVTPSLSAANVRTFLRSSADQIGLQAYTNGRNPFHGFGRVNMFRAIVASSSLNGTLPLPVCNPGAFSYTVANDLLLPDLAPALPFCAALGPLPVADEFCFPIRASNGNFSVICL